MNEELQRQRLSAILAVVKRRGRQGLGRTALMKFLYFLQQVRGVDLGYNFTLYTYGPFDAAVLEDLSSTTSLGAHLGIQMPK